MRLAGLGLICVVCLSPQIGCNSRQPANQPVVAQSPTSSPATAQSPASPSSAESARYPNLVTLAQDVNDAFRRRDFARMVDLTYPKVIEAAGGRDKMVAALTKGVNEMEAEGVVVLSSTAGTPTQIINADESLYAVVPTTLKVKAQDGVFQTEGSMIGISKDSGATWTFIDAGGKDRPELKRLLPGIGDKLNLPPAKEPVKISGN